MCAGETISLAALVQRINRHLKSEYQQLKKTRSDRTKRAGLGDYYVIDLRRNCPVYLNVNPEVFARERRLLREDETVKP